MSWPQVPKIQDNVTLFDAASVNPIINALEERTNNLQRLLTTTDITDGVAFTDIGFDGCVKGQFVSYNPATNAYIPAAAALDSLKDGGLVFPSDASYVVGLLITDVVNNQGTILTSGVLRNKSMIASVLGSSNHVPGNYYLTAEGGVTRDKSKVVLPIKCCTLTASGCLVVNIQIPDFRTHDHIKYKLKPYVWKSSALPEYAHSYSAEDDRGIVYLLNTLNTESCLIVNNAILGDGEYLIDNDVIYLKNKVDTDIDATLFLVNPFTGSTQCLSSVTTAPGVSLFEINQVGRKAVIDVKAPVTQVSGKGTAVVDVQGSGISVSKVVHEVVAGPGLIADNVEGVVTLSTSNSRSRLLDFNLLNANGVVFGGTEEFLFKFPKGYNTSILGQVHIPSDVGTSVTAKLVLYVKGTGTTVGLGEVRIVRFNLADDESAVSRTSTVVNGAAAINGDLIYKLESSEITVSSNELLNITIAYNSPSDSLNVCYVGLKIGE